ncbi:30S ribosomal protein S20 [bacterium]|nr:30S ribosomal protein S20 [bacterium]
MPIIKSAKKRVKQAEKRRQRNYPIRSLMKTNIKKVLTMAAQGNKEEAEKLLPVAYKTIDTAAKKNIIHNKNADNKKSRLARAIARIGEAKVGTKNVKTSKKSKPTKEKVDTKDIKKEKDVKETSAEKTKKAEKKEVR